MRLAIILILLSIEETIGKFCLGKNYTSLEMTNWIEGLFYFTFFFLIPLCLDLKDLFMCLDLKDLFK